MATVANKEYPEAIVVQVDTREQYPIVFPANVRIPHPSQVHKSCLVKVHTEKKKLEAGDYCLAGFDSLCIIERKASALELYKNLFHVKDKARQGRALTKLVAGTEFPYLMIEASPKELLDCKLPNDTDPELLIGKIAGMVARYGLRLLWLPRRNTLSGRRSMGLVLTHIMLGHLLDRYYNTKPKLI